ncbi:MAG: metal-dependent transcriptional regulator [Ruminococcaceae bacterium]|nr:metal-dependent transcriptional regulator [Oscillospiraceae bacterium]
MALQESGEMYLETILILSQKLGQVRSVDISEHMGYSKPSVSRAVGLLKKGGFITVEKEGFIHLTDEGLSLAQKILERHTILTELLIRLGVGNETAANDACRIEHVISDETFEAIRNHMLAHNS